MDLLPFTRLPNGEPSFRSFAHDKKFDAFLRQKRIEDKYFGGKETLEAHDKYTSSVWVRYVKACQETEEPLEEQESNQGISFLQKMKLFKDEPSFGT